MLRQDVTELGKHAVHFLLPGSASLLPPQFLW